MASKIAKVSYDSKEDILYVRLGEPISDSIPHGEFVIDFSKEKIVGMEIANASKQLFEGLPKEIDPKKSLASIKEARFGVREAKGILWIGIAFRIIWQEKEYRPLLQISVPQVVMA